MCVHELQTNRQRANLITKLEGPKGYLEKAIKKKV